MNLFYRKSLPQNSSQSKFRPLIILHGLFGMSDNWMTLSKQFADSGFSVYLPDARNHGRSAWSDGFNYEVMAEDLLELIETIDRENINNPNAGYNIIGHSMGGKTAMYFACKYPEKISKLIIADITPRYYPSQNQKVIDVIESIDLSSLSTRKQVETKLKETLDEATVQFLLKSLYWKTDKQLAWRFNFEAIKNNIDRMSDALPPSYFFEKAALFLKGENSEYITGADAEPIKQHFPKAIIETIPDAGHWIHAENPAGFMQSALRFLAS